LPQARAGKLRALGVTSAKRSSLAPELPTVAEAGVPGYEAITWYGVLAPRATPHAVIGTLNREIAAVLGASEFRERLAALGIEPTASTPQEFANYLKADIAKWTRAIRDAGVTLN
jgi:tripartite-type tricarboxylate transporter receptor subunit TctC